MQKCIWYSPSSFCFDPFYDQKSQIPRVKKAYRRLFCAGASSMTQPLFLLKTVKIKSALKEFGILEFEKTNFLTFSPLLQF